jgi:hypothetical protein
VKKLKTKDMIMLGIVIGIGLFFFGAIISKVFPSSEANLLSYKISAVIKLLGLGVLTTTMIIGGITIEDLDKNLKILLLILGLILLVIYAIASPVLEWQTSSTVGSSSSGYETRPTGLGIPGFELPLVIAAAFMILLWKRKNKS